MRILASLFALALLLPVGPDAGCDPGEDVKPSLRAERLAAFARLYGYVRFFHPSDEAARLDWGRFAVYGADRVAALETGDDLRATLEELFLPMAPTLRIYEASDGEATAAAGPVPAPEDAAPEDAVLVAWQHRGVGLGFNGPYKSVRANRPVDPLERRNSASRYFDNEDFEGYRYRLSAQVRARADDDLSGGRLLLQVMNDRYESYIDEDLRERLVTDPAWSRVELAGTFEQATRFISYGIGLAGLGEACFDDVRFEVARENGEWRPLEVENAGFETSVVGIPRGWDYSGYGYSFLASRERPHEGARSGCIRSATGYLPGTLFKALPSAGEELDKELGAGLRVRLPIALLLDREPPGDTPEPLARLLDRLAASELDQHSGDDLATRAGGIAIAWSIFQHFYPYFDVVPVDWDSVLPAAMDRVLADRSSRDYLDTLRWLLARLEDGHAGAFHPELWNAGLDVEFGWIEGQLVVLDALADSGLERGDVVETIDGVPAAEVMAARTATRSGSPQWRRRRALLVLAPGPEGEPVELGLERGGRRLTVAVTRTMESRRKNESPVFTRLAEDVWLVDLTRASMSEIDERIELLAEARGVVFDLRGYPNSNHDVLRHLTSVPMLSAKWLVPQYIYPDQERLAGYDNSGRWTLDPREPRFGGKVVFLTDARAISYAESFMGIVEAYRLGEIVGEPTAGTNGNVNRMTLPGGYSVNWTGMRVIKNDNSQHHLIGIQPTVPVSPTLAGIRAGRDEQLEAALELIGR